MEEEPMAIITTIVLFDLCLSIVIILFIIYNDDWHASADTGERWMRIPKTNPLEVKTVGHRLQLVTGAYIPTKRVIIHTSTPPRPALWRVIIGKVKWIFAVRVFDGKVGIVIQHHQRFNAHLTWGQMGPRYFLWKFPWSAFRVTPPRL